MTEIERRHIAHVALLVLDLTPKAMRRLATNNKRKMTPEQVSQKYFKNKDNKDCKLYLERHEEEMLKNPGPGFINCDTSCLYKIIRHHQLVTDPTQGWGKQVNRFSTNGDLVEALRQYRNLLVHRPHARFPEREMIHMKSNLCEAITSVSVCFDRNEELKHQVISYMAWP